MFKSIDEMVRGRSKTNLQYMYMYNMYKINNPLKDKRNITSLFDFPSERKGK